jgi:hypothetical protein
MLIKLGDIVGTASGSLRSNTYSRNRFGAYIRNRTIPVNPNTARQSTVRTFMQVLTSLWLSTLTPAQRAQWSAYGENVPLLNRLGDAINLTGLNHYVRSNIPRLLAGLTRVDDGPVIFTLPGPVTDADCAYAADTQLVSVSFDDTLDMFDVDDSALLVYTGLPVNPSVNYFNSPFRFAGSIDGSVATPPTSPETMASPFTIQEAQKVFHKFRVSLADGRLSDFFRSGSAIVAAS